MESGLQSAGEAVGLKFRAPGEVGTLGYEVEKPKTAGQNLYRIGTGAGMTGLAAAAPVASVIGGATLGAVGETETGKKILGAAGKGLEKAGKFLLENNAGVIRDIYDKADPEFKAMMEQDAASAPLLLLGAKSEKGVRKAVTQPGKGLKSAGEKIYSSVLPTSAREAELMQAYEANMARFKRGEIKTEPVKPTTLGETAGRFGVVGTRANVGRQAAERAPGIFEKEVNPALKSSKTVLGVDDVFSDLEKSVNDIRDPSIASDYRAVLDDMKAGYTERYPNGISMSDAQAIKTDLQAVLPQKALKGKDVTGVLANMRNELRQSLRQKMLDALEKEHGTNFKQKYLDYGNLQALKELGVKARTQGGLGLSVGGGTRTLIADILQASLTPIGTFAGKVLYSAGEGLEFVGNAGAKIVGDIFKTATGKKFGKTVEPTAPVAPVAPVSNVKTKTVDVSELTPTPPVRQSSVSAERPNRRRPGGTETTRRLTRGMEGQRPGKEVVTKQRLGERRPAREGAFQEGTPKGLAEEAKKYKTADEFFKNSGFKLRFHQTSPEIAQKIESE